MQEKNRLLLLAALLLALGVVAVDSWLVTIPRWLGTVLLGAALLLLAIYWLKRSGARRQSRYAERAAWETDTEQPAEQEQLPEQEQPAKDDRQATGIIPESEVKDQTNNQ